MSPEDKQDILAFVNFYVVLKIVRLRVLCKHIGISERTIQRWNKFGVNDKRKGAQKHIPRKLTKKEKQLIYQTACNAEYKDMNPHEIYNSLLDNNIYMASASSFYRILREQKAITHRTESKEGTSRKKPDELEATKPNQVWMWDITWLKRDITGLYYYAYVIEDLYDRSIVGWAIYDHENDQNAKELFERVTKKEHAHPAFVHSDNGNPMKGITLVAFYYQLGIVPSFSRPRVSDDNPYIESFFKTLKHTCGYPRCFTTITNAREWFANFINWYNQEHKHSGLQYVTPMQKRTGKHISIFRKRNKILQAAKDKHPERWGCRATKKYSVVNAEILNPAENKSA